MHPFLQVRDSELPADAKRNVRVRANRRLEQRDVNVNRLATVAQSKPRRERLLETLSAGILQGERLIKHKLCFDRLAGWTLTNNRR